MKKIQHPNLGQISLALVPVLLLSMLFILLQSVHLWLLAVAGAFLFIYMALASYFCIRQKCYLQLGFAYINVALYVGLIALIIHINT